MIQGNRAGEAGIITRIMRNSEGLDSHATVTMMEDSSHSDLTVLVNNLRLRTEIDPSTQGKCFEKNLNHIVYYAGELVIYENQNKKGLIIQTNADSVSVLNEQNQFESIKISEINKKITYDKRLMVATDCENNVITRGTIIKIRDKNSPLKG